MDKPIISYHVLQQDSSYTKQSSFYAGTYTGRMPLEVSIRIWNNYKGVEDVEDLYDFSIVAHFLTKEDNALLPYVKMSVTNDIEIPIIVENDAAVGRFVDPVVLRGGANTGSDEYTNNYINVTITFDTGADVYLKDHDLKSLIIEIVEL